MTHLQIAAAKALTLIDSFALHTPEILCGPDYETATELRAALKAAQQVEVPTGYVLVPIEPTPAILDAMSSSGWKTASYKAMLAAAVPLRECHYESPTLRVCNKCGRRHDKAIFSAQGGNNAS